MREKQVYSVDQLLNSYTNNGWVALPFNEDLYHWAKGVKINVDQSLSSMEDADKDLRCGGTWFPGVNFLDNDSHGNIESYNFPSKLKGLIKKL